MRSLWVVVLAFTFLTGCSDSESEKVKPLSETVFENQIKVLEKAKEVEQILNEEAKRRQDALDK